MAPKVATLATLTPSKARYQITARATRIWEVAAKDADKPYSLDMVLLDHEGDQIHATIPRRLINQYAETLKEGTIYKIQHFEVAGSARSYRPVTSTNNIIKWTPFTSIVQDDQSLPIAKHKFEFCPFDSLAQRTNKLDHLIDVVGLLTTVESKQQALTSKGETQLRHIYIEDERNHNVRVTLWGKTADLIEESTIINGSEQKAVIITSTKVVDFKGETQVQSTYATKVYVNLEIPETRKLTERVDKQTGVKFVDNCTAKGPEEPEYKTIDELMQMDMLDEMALYICSGTITNIRTDVEWRYISCPNCKSGLNEEGKCRECKNKIDYPIQR
ncbi:hypothetical protein RND81_05G040700 [Saponaria officinalis]|uniref:Uncharacterized protein n=1 Tax=Saponaria officinalis TaxID=3572 RepID=A0AAW1KTJ1_SAPOF